jgi:hypothetical protein
MIGGLDCCCGSELAQGASSTLLWRGLAIKIFDRNLCFN